MNARKSLLALSLLGIASLASSETWDPADVAEAKRLQAEEAARAVEYRERVARGDIRAEEAPMPREAPQQPGERGEVETLGDFFDRLFRRPKQREAEPRRERSREELRREKRRDARRDEREPAPDDREDADDWWEEEERRMRGAR